MDAREPPPITIEGGSGWQLAMPGQAPDTVGVEPAPVRSQSARRRGLGALALAAALGFAAATALAEQRQSSLDDSPEGVLSLDVVLDDQTAGSSSGLVTTSQGRLAVVSSVVLRNTGPRPVALEDAELLGTGFRAEDLDGRRLPDGGRTVLRLLRPVDCEQVGATSPPGPLRVRATTGAGQRTVELSVSPDLGFVDRESRGACGLAEPAEALIVMDSRPAEVGPTVQVSAELSNASASPLLVNELRVPEGLRITSVHDQQGRPLTLPLTIAAGSYDPPRERFAGRGPLLVVVVEVAVADCAQLRPSGPDVFVPIVEAEVSDVAGRRAGGAGWGDPTVVDRLRRTQCDAAVGTLAELAPAPDWYRSRRAYAPPD